MIYLLPLMNHFFKTLSSVNICWTGIFSIYGRVRSTFQHLSITNGNQHNKILFFILCQKVCNLTFLRVYFQTYSKPTNHNQRDILRRTVNKTKKEQKQKITVTVYLINMSINLTSISIDLLIWSRSYKY